MPSSKRYTLYHLHHYKDYGNYSTGYISVSPDVKSQWFKHIETSKKCPTYNKHITQAVNHNDIHLTIIATGTKSEMKEQEMLLRPHKNMGWNKLPAVATRTNKPYSICGCCGYKKSRCSRRKSSKWEFIVNGIKYYLMSDISEVTGLPMNVIRARVKSDKYPSFIKKKRDE